MKIRFTNALWSARSKLSILTIASMLSACATTSFQSRTPDYTGTPVSAVYLYSFLDLREGNLGKNFLAEVKRQLAEAFAKDGVRTKQLWFNESPVRAQFSLAETGPNPSNTSTRVPVDEVIKASQGDEQLFGATHRLIAFPVSVMNANTGASFHIRWDLIDLRTNKVAWSTTSFSYHAKWFLGDENPEERAHTFVQGLMAELRKAKVIQSHGT